jgi:hypothetical protein
LNNTNARKERIGAESGARPVTSLGVEAAATAETGAGVTTTTTTPITTTTITTVRDVIDNSDELGRSGERSFDESSTSEEVLLTGSTPAGPWPGFADKIANSLSVLVEVMKHQSTPAAQSPSSPSSSSSSSAPSSTSTAASLDVADMHPVISSALAQDKW